MPFEPAYVFKSPIGDVFGHICDALAKMTTREAQTEGLLNEWMVLARYDKRVHEEASCHSRK